MPAKFVIAASFVPGMFGQYPDADAFALLHKAMELDARRTYTAIVDLNPWNEEASRVKIDQSNCGRYLMQVLSPVSMKGRTFLNDGKQWYAFKPDQNLVLIQESPMPRPSGRELDLRYELLRRNYEASIEGTEFIAGREAVRIRIVPKEREKLFARKYWVDTEKLVILRVSETHPSGTSRTVSDTISISFLQSLPKETFELRLSGEPREIRMKGPERCSSIAKLSEKVGFRVVQPIRMPAGFTFTRAEALLAGDGSYTAALRYTDGAANVTFYQFKRKSRPSRVDATVDGIYIRVEGDLPSVMRSVLADTIRLSGSSAEASLTKRLEEMTSFPSERIASLRSMGLTFDDAVGLISLASGNERQLAVCLSLMRSGKCLEDIAAAVRVPVSKATMALQKFWKGLETSFDNIEVGI